MSATELLERYMDQCPLVAIIRGVTSAEAEAMIRAQMPAAKKRERADLGRPAHRALRDYQGYSVPLGSPQFVTPPQASMLPAFSAANASSTFFWVSAVMRSL